VAQACAHAAARLLATHHSRPQVVFTGPGAEDKLTAELLAQCTLYVQPGGGSLKPAYKRLRSRRKLIREFVSSGGGYLGLCLGGYLAGNTPGFGLLPGDARRYIGTKTAEISHSRDTVVRIDWADRSEPVFFQDGPAFDIDESSATVLARYLDGSVAAAVARFGQGAVAVCGPHPEATPDWFDDIKPAHPFVDGTGRGHSLIDALEGLRLSNAGRRLSSAVELPRDNGTESPAQVVADTGRV
jgi:hypothetical protein